MHRLDPEELEMALMYLAGALPCKFKWVALVTVDGRLLGHYRVPHSPDAIEWVVTSVQSFGSRLTHQAGSGAFQQNITVGEDGVTITLCVDEQYLICLNVGQVKSLDLVLSAVREGLTPLFDVLGVKAR